MKGSMIFSLITLCVVMLFMEERISDFLHGSEPAEKQSGFLPEMDFLSNWGEALAGFWQDGTDFLASVAGAAVNKPDQEQVVITEDTIQRVWVWRDGGAIQSAPEKPSHGRARQVLIPEDMTVAEFFDETATDDTAEKTAQQSDDPPSAPQAESQPTDGRTGTPLDRLSPSQRKAMLEQGMDVLQQSSGSPGSRNAR
jgi:pyruvate/2-oxoglutarate dehydrogenase complex dihydrolipoamide acyltransferase (E2) component